MAALKNVIENSTTKRKSVIQDSVEQRLAKLESALKLYVPTGNQYNFFVFLKEEVVKDEKEPMFHRICGKPQDSCYFLVNLLSKLFG